MPVLSKFGTGAQGVGSGLDGGAEKAISDCLKAVAFTLIILGIFGISTVIAEYSHYLMFNDVFTGQAGIENPFSF